MVSIEISEFSTPIERVIDIAQIHLRLGNYRILLTNDRKIRISVAPDQNQPKILCRLFFTIP